MKFRKHDGPAKSPWMGRGLICLGAMLPVLVGTAKSEAKPAPKSAAKAPKPAEKPAVLLFKTSGPSVGAALDPDAAPAKHSEADHKDEDGHESEHEPIVGRTTPLQAVSFAALLGVKAGQRVQLPLAGGKVVEGIINIVRDDKGWTRVGGSLSDDSGSFSLSFNGEKAGGLVQQKKAGIAHRITQTGDTVQMRETLLSSLICNIPRPDFEGNGARAARPMSAPPVVPVLNSRPTAVAQIYLDFDGETVTDPLWNEGKTIVAPAYDLSETEITAIFNRVKEDYAPFNINVTTEAGKYTNAPVGKRMRCIITPNDVAGPGTGGVAYLTSFRNAGTGSFTSDIPCWVFNGSVVGVSEAVSHEVGHTFGLIHDGRTLVDNSEEEYFQGHGAGTTGWAPIMGVSYSKVVAQWSKGEYALANNKEDDVAIIGGNENGVGFPRDEAGNIRPAAVALSEDGTIARDGLISQSSDADFYSFKTAGGLFEVTAEGAAPSPNLDIALEIQNENGLVVASDNPADGLSAGLSENLEPGNYFLKVSGSGAGDPSSDGYSSYGSIGAYSLSGRFVISLDLSIRNASVKEGSDEATPSSVDFVLSLSFAPKEQVTVKYATSDGTATAGEDYTSTSGTVTFAIGEKSKTISVPVTSDVLVEANETFTVKLSDVKSAILVDDLATGTISNDDLGPDISISASGDNFKVAEGDSGDRKLNFTVSLSTLSEQEITVNYATTAFTANNGADFLGASGQLTFAPKEKTKTIEVLIRGDKTDENDETFGLTLSSATNAQIKGGAATATILDDDAAPSIAARDISVVEGNSGTTSAIFTFTLSTASSFPISFDYDTADDSATEGNTVVESGAPLLARDYESLRLKTMTFEPGQTSKSLTIQVVGDRMNEATERFLVKISNPSNAVVPDAIKTVTIFDDDAVPAVSINDVSMVEGSQGNAVNANFTIRLSAASGKTVKVAYGTQSGTATESSDYRRIGGTVVFASGETTKTISIPIISDTIDEEDETFALNIVGASNATIADKTGLATIRDDDATPSLSISSVSMNEGNAGSKTANFVVRLSAPTGRTVTTRFATGNRSARAGSDYVAQEGTLTFEPGQTFKTISIAITGDTLLEADEVFRVILSRNVGAGLRESEGIGTIINDDRAANSAGASGASS